jgi:type IV secretion system protein VirB10
MSVPAEEPPVIDAKTAVRLRADPPATMRLSRVTLAVAGGAVALSVGLALAIALRPPRPAPAVTNPPNTDSRAPSETITSGPKDYGQVPRLGPPLPGDLGRPIVSAQARGASVPPPTMGRPSSTDAALAAPARPRSPSPAAQARDAARTSALFAALNTHAATPTGVARADLAMPPMNLNPASSTAEPPTGARQNQDAERAFLERADTGSTTNTGRLAPPVSPYVVQAGSVISAALLTGLRSDLPGQMTAQVTQDVYDSPTGAILLVPQGARLIGTYDAEIGFGQKRVLLAWTRLILPDGRSLNLDRQPGADAQGFAGLEDQVDHHWGAMFKAAALSTLLGIGAELGSGSDDDLTRAVREGYQDTVNQTGRQVVTRQLDVQPTLTIRPGFSVRVLVTRDLVLEPYPSKAR